MLLDSLDYFISAARLGSFTKAAQEWDVMQSTISQSIASLEQELQCPLFIRGAKGVSLTERGQIFFLDALRLKKSFEQAVTSARALESPGKKGLTIRLSSFMDSLPLLEPLSRLKNSDPDLELSFSLGDDSNWDLALIRMPETENRYSEWEYFPFGEKKLMVLIPPNHPLLGIPFLTLEILSQFSERLYLTQNAYDMAGSFLSPEKSFLLSEDSLLAPVCLVNRCPGLDMRWDSGSFLPGLTSQEIQGCDMRQAQCFQYSLCNTNPAITDFLSCLEMV